MCYEKILDISNRAGSESFVGIFKYAGMSKEIGETNMRLFVREVMSELNKVGPAAGRLVVSDRRQACVSASMLQAHLMSCHNLMKVCNFGRGGVTGPLTVPTSELSAM